MTWLQRYIYIHPRLRKLWVLGVLDPLWTARSKLWRLTLKEKP